MWIVSYSDRPNETEYSLLEMYNKLTNEHFVTNEEVKNGKELERIISWLPFIEMISVERTPNNDWLDILFANGSKIRIYNTGLELAFDMLVED